MKTFRKTKTSIRNNRPPRNLGRRKVPADSSAKEVRERELIAMLADQFVTPVPDNEAKELENDLKAELDVDDDDELDSQHLWEGIDASDHRLVIEKGNTEYLQAFAIAWRIFDYITSSRDRLAEEIPKIAARAGMKITAKFDPLIATFRSTIKYGDKDRRLWSRDAQAVRWLKRDNKATPDTVIKYQEDHGGGVDPWARDEQKRRRKERSESGEAQMVDKKLAAQLLVNLRRELGQGQRAILMVKKDGATLVWMACQKLAKSDKSKYWPKIKKALGVRKPLNLRSPAK